MEENENTTDHQTSPVDHNLELLIDKKISDARLLASEKRLSLTLTIGAAVLGVFGVVLPMLLVFQSASRVDTSIHRMEDKLTQLTDKLSDKADASAQKMEDKFVLLADKSSNRIDSSIHRMEERFKEMAGKQLRRPRLDCFVDGKRLAGGSLVFDPKNTRKLIEIKNLGDGTADQVRMRLYLNYEDEDLLRDLNNEFWIKSEVNDRPEFAVMFVYGNESVVIPAQASAAVQWWMQNPQLRKTNIKTRALLKIFYGEPMPDEVPFSLEIRTQ